MTTIFGSSSKNSSTSVFGTSTKKEFEPDTNIPNAKTKSTVIGNIYSNISSKVDSLSNVFFSENIDNIKPDELEDMVTSLYSYRISTDKKLNSIIDLLINNVSLIVKAQEQKITNQELLKSLEYFKEKAAILDNLEQLKTFLEDKKKDIVLFEEKQEQLNVQVEIPQEYEYYLLEYGYPENGVFDLKRIAEIKVRYNII